ncbi:hypothetical protein OH492_06670 [Vibrio chagasii]|nr:hypothetical protein [Vibrio chagasii]
MAQQQPLGLAAPLITEGLNHLSTEKQPNTSDGSFGLYSLFLLSSYAGLEKALVIL